MGLSGGVEWAKGSIPVSPVEAGLGNSSSGPLGPTFNKAFTSILGRPSSSRAPFEPVGGAVGLEMELLAIEDVIAEESLPGRLKFADKALLEEASRYPAIPKISSFSLGLRGSSSSSPLWGPDEALVESEGVSNGAEGAMGRIPLRVVQTEDVSILDGWNEPLWGSIDVVSANELALVPIGSDYASPLEERIDCHLE